MGTSPRPLDDQTFTNGPGGSMGKNRRLYPIISEKPTVVNPGDSGGGRVLRRGVGKSCVENTHLPTGQFNAGKSQ
jgi:hypothetical protein